MKTLNLKLNLMTVALAFGAFDANSLLMVELSTAEFDTERTLIGEGEFQYKIGKPKINGGDKDGKNWARLTLPLELVDQNELARIGVDKIGARYETFLDLTEENALAQGPNLNINLGRAFEAVGLRGSDATIGQLEGHVIIGRTKVKKSDQSGVEYNEVTHITAVE